MSDIVGELNKAANEMCAEGQNRWPNTCREAADRIAALEAENERMRKVINQTRLAFGGMVSVQSVIDLIDTLGSAHNASGPRGVK